MPKKTPQHKTAPALSGEALAVLRGKIRVEGQAVLITEQLERAVYEEVHEVLARLGASYIQGARVHEFPYDPAPLLKAVLEQGYMPEKNPLEFFYTTPGVVSMIKGRLDPRRNENTRYFLYWLEERQRPFRILEPSAGLGHLAEMLRELFPAATIHCCELDPYRRAALQARGFTIVADDFMQYAPQEPYDLAVLNPPFGTGGENDTYVRHIMHAMELLRDSEMSELHALAPMGFVSSQQVILSDFYTFVLEHGGLDALPRDAFKESGTMAQVALLWLEKRPSREFRDLALPLWGYPNGRVCLFMERVREEPGYTGQLERILERMVRGELTVYTNGRPGPDTLAAVADFCQSVQASARRHFQHLPLLPADYALVAREVLERYENEYDYLLQGLRERHEASKAVRLDAARRAVTLNRSTIARARTKIEEMERDIATREINEAALLRAFQALEAQLEQDPGLVLPARPEAPEPVTLLEMIDSLAPR